MNVQDKISVAILMGSDSDLSTLQEAIHVLSEFHVAYDVKVLSAHRTPRQTVEYVEHAPRLGVKVFIAAAGGAAHLAGVIAAHTTLPVIGVPIQSSALNGMDSLLSTVQMPGGIPVATMAIGKAGAKNAGLFAIEILALLDEGLGEKMKAYREQMTQKVIAKNEGLLRNVARSD